jgi:hypothetical protein
VTLSSSDADNAVQVTSVLSTGAPPIRTYVRKEVLTSDFVASVQGLTGMKNAHLKNGKMLWEDDNIRADYSLNAPDSEEIHFNI